MSRLCGRKLTGGRVCQRLKTYATDHCCIVCAHNLARKKATQESSYELRACANPDCGYTRKQQQESKPVHLKVLKSAGGVCKYCRHKERNIAWMKTYVLGTSPSLDRKYRFFQKVYQYDV